MAQFAKIWTTIFNDEWFLSLTGIERGIFLQLIVLIKQRSDDGHICTPSVQHLANELAVDRRTLGRFLTKMDAKCPGADRPLTGTARAITLPNYLKYQQLTSKKSNIAPNIEQSRAEQSRAEQIGVIIADLNEKTGKKFSPKTDSTRKSIEARLKEGRTLKDFQTVHDVKCKEWLGTDMSKFLRPATLYQPGKFETYLNQDTEKPKTTHLHPEHKTIFCVKCNKLTKHELDPYSFTDEDGRVYGGFKQKCTLCGKLQDE